MEQYISKEERNDYLFLPKTFDWDLVDQEVGFGKIFQVFPEEFYLELKDSNDEVKKKLYKLLTKAGVYYSFIFSIPKIKVHISNYGIQEFNQDKVKSSPWWDVRDLGLSMLKIADKNLSDAITKVSKSSFKSDVPFFANVSNIICTPEAFNGIYSINYSTDAYLTLQKFIKKALLLNVYDKLSSDCFEAVKENTNLNIFLKDALAFYALYYASLLPGFIFTQSAVVVQYDELPWQKSIVLDENSKMRSGQNFLKLADESIKVITDYIKKNLSEFPCYSAPIPERKIEVRDSGIYL